MDRPEFVISEETGKEILDWCHRGTKTEQENSSQNSPKILNVETLNQNPSQTSKKTKLPQISVEEAFDNIGPYSPKNRAFLFVGLSIEQVPYAGSNYPYYYPHTTTHKMIKNT